MRWALIGVMIGGCYSPTIPTGASCDKDHPCPRPLICATSTNTCQKSDVDAAVDDAEQPLDAFVPPIDSPPLQGCTPMGFDVCGDGIDQDCDGADETCAVNDLAADAIDVTMGGTLNADLNFARDNAPQRGCGNDGGRDLYYKVTLTAPEVYYFDTFGSNFDVTVRVFPGKTCAAITAADNPACSDDTCNSANSQLALQLPVGTSCVVVDQNNAATQGALTFKVVRGGHAGSPAMSGPHTVTGDTCNSTDVFRACNEPNAKEDAWFFTVCPGTTAHMDASTCTDAANNHFDTVLYVRKTNTTANPTIDCEDDSDTCTMVRPDREDGAADLSVLDDVPASGPGLFWLVLDGYDAGACGGYQMDYNLH